MTRKRRLAIGLVVIGILLALGVMALVGWWRGADTGQLERETGSSLQGGLASSSYVVGATG